jgi:hypothetical protein
VVLTRRRPVPGGFPELEYTLGLLDSDRSVKPVGRRFAELIVQERRAPTSHVVGDTAVVFDPDEGQGATDRSLTGPGSAVFETWLAVATGGTRPALVRQSVAADGALLEARGIDHVVASAAVRASEAGLDVSYRVCTLRRCEHESGVAKHNGQLPSVRLTGRRRCCGSIPEASRAEASASR